MAATTLHTADTLALNKAQLLGMLPTHGITPPAGCSGTQAKRLLLGKPILASDPTPKALQPEAEATVPATAPATVQAPAPAPVQGLPSLRTLLATPEAKAPLYRAKLASLGVHDGGSLEGLKARVQAILAGQPVEPFGYPAVQGMVTVPLGTAKPQAKPTVAAQKPAATAPAPVMNPAPTTSEADRKAVAGTPVVTPRDLNALAAVVSNLCDEYGVNTVVRVLQDEVAARSKPAPAKHVVNSRIPEVVTAPTPAPVVVNPEPAPVATPAPVAAPAPKVDRKVLVAECKALGVSAKGTNDQLNARVTAALSAKSAKPVAIDQANIDAPTAPIAAQACVQPVKAGIDLADATVLQAAALIAKRSGVALADVKAALELAGVVLS